MNVLYWVPKAAVMVVFVVASACAASSTLPAASGTAPTSPTSVATEVPTPTATIPPTAMPREASPTAEPEVVLPPGDYAIALPHDGRDRSYRIHVPSTVTSRAAVLVALHGGGGTGEGFQEENGMDSVANREGFIVVYPEGSGVLPNRLHTWNSGFNCCGYSLDNDIDDVGFLRAVIDDVDARTSIDRGRVYMTGHSNGAMMAYRFAVEAADMVVAIAPVAGALSMRDPAPSQTVALLHIHSVDDPRALYEGGQGPPFPGTERTHVAESVVPGIGQWAELNGCDPASTIADTIIGTDDNDGQHVDRLVWDCPAGAAVEHLRLAGTGHGWPGVTVRPIWQRQLGPPTTLVNASEEVWAFVSQFSRG